MLDHVTANVKWSTKETVDNPSTKGSIKFKNCLVLIDENNQATINNLTEFDRIRLKNRSLGIVRVITSYGGLLRDAINQMSLKHGPIKTSGGGCGTLWYITELFNSESVTMLQLLMGDKIRILMENEGYYRDYDIGYDNDWDEDCDD